MTDKTDRRWTKPTVKSVAPISRTQGGVNQRPVEDIFYNPAS